MIAAIPTSLLRTVLLVEGAAVLTAVLLVFGHGIGRKYERGWRLPRLAAGRAALAEFVDGGEEDRDRAVAVLGGLPRRVRTQALEEAAAGVRTGEIVAIADAARVLGLERRARRWCGSRRWWRRARGIHQLTLWGDGDVRADLITDRDAVVRARAIEWAGDHPTEGLVDLVLARLADPSLLCRWTAQDAVLRAGAIATAPLARRLDAATATATATGTGTDLELLLGLASRAPDPSFQDTALRLVADERPAVRARAAAVLAALGGADGTAALESLLADAEPEPRMVAAEGLGRLRHWPAAAAVGRLLADPVWDVRRAAGTALAAMDAPGRLLLGRYASGANDEVAQAARHALDIARLTEARAEGSGA